MLITENNPTRPCVFIIDDEPSILRALQRLLASLEVDTVIFDNADTAFGQLRNQNPDVIICDIKMPGTDGIEFMAQAATEHPLCERILLTGFADMDTAISAINKSHVDYYLEKPWDDKQLLGVVTKGLEHTAVRRRNQYLEQLTRQQNTELSEWNQQLEQKVEARTQQLQNAYSNTVKTFASLVEQRLHGHQSSSQKVADWALRLAEQQQLDRKRTQSLYWAAVLRNIGKVGFSDHLLDTPYLTLTAKERDLYQQHPRHGAAALCMIKPLRDTSSILAQRCEQLNGQGYPNQLTDTDILPEAKILALISDYVDALDGYYHERALTEREAYSWLQEQPSGRYDDRLLDKFLTLLQQQHERCAAEWHNDEEYCIAVSALQTGMQLSRDLLSPAGTLLLAKGKLLDESLIDNLCHLQQNYPQPLQLFIRPEANGEPNGTK